MPPEGRVTWQSPSRINPKQRMDEELQDLIFTQADRELPGAEIYEKLQNEGVMAGRNVNREKVIQSVQRRKRSMKAQIGRDGGPQRPKQEKL